MNATTLTRKIIHAAATDTGNRSMRAAGRTTWDDDDWNAAAAEERRLTDFLNHDDIPLPSAAGR